MSVQLKEVPACIVRELKNEKIPANCVIFYKEDVGWVYRPCDSDIMFGLSQPTVYSSKSTELVPHDQNKRRLERLGPFGIRPTNISLSIIQDSDMYQVQVDGQLRALAKYIDIENVGQHAPIAPVTLNRAARDAAHIPQDATHFCWAYPPVGFTQLSQKKKAEIDQKLASDDPDYTFLALGGFAYFRFDNCTFKKLQINSLVKADSGLNFNGPHRWQAEYTEHLFNEGRFQDVTISELLELGIKYYCFINPREKLKSSQPDGAIWIPADNGGFVYLYDMKGMPHIYDCYFTVAHQSSTASITTGVMPFSLITKKHQSTLRQRPSSEDDSRTESLLSVSHETTDQFNCSICLVRTVRCIFIPCKHMCTCAECAESVKEKLHSVCPICRKAFTEVWNVFL
ncbi:unnamed protein product [Rotaria magnacalcarata]|uniref:RING-type domain-containing protein n=1 Tax=Rotaria magnacalcarata TaxID=392030 RepID=A0A814MDX5_9BILA|nr:unnamed protein product [Rotaria magnacalcarata]